MLIDVHAHFGRDAPAARLTTYAGLSNVDFVLVSNRDGAVEPPGAPDLDETETNLACLDACRQQARLVPLYWLRPGRLDSNVYTFAGALATEPFAGAVLSPSAAAFDADASLLDEYLDVLAQLERPALFCIGNEARSAPARVLAVARRHPGLPIVLCACGVGDARRREMLDVARQARRAGDANLYVDTSHATQAEVRQAVEALGSDRVLYGTNAIAFGDTHVPRHIALLDELRQALAPADYQQVTANNALRLFRLPVSPSRR